MAKLANWRLLRTVRRAIVPDSPRTALLRVGATGIDINGTLDPSDGP